MYIRTKPYTRGWLTCQSKLVRTRDARAWQASFARYSFPVWPCTTPGIEARHSSSGITISAKMLQKEEAGVEELHGRIWPNLVGLPFIETQLMIRLALSTVHE